MTTPSRLSVESDERLESLQQHLADSGVKAIVGSVCNAAGIFLGKTVPLERLATFHRSGLGASPTWNAFTIDGAIAPMEKVSAIGDMRLRLDVDGIRILDDGLAWAPVEMFDQLGDPLDVCARGALRKVQAQAEASGLTTLVGHELEFLLVAEDADSTGPWTPYGLAPLLDREAFALDFLQLAHSAGLVIEQLHAEFVEDQFEFSLPPLPPLEAADSVVLARLILGRVARRHGLRASFSPVPFVDRGGSGAHLHFSFARGGESLFSGGSGPRGMQPDGAAAVAGVVDLLSQIQAILAGSILSGLRLKPGNWAGAFACWGLENREASVRFVDARPGNPLGANVEVKIIDPSANPYLATAAVLAAALHGIAESTALPDEVAADPTAMSAAELDAAGASLLPTDLARILQQLDGSSTVRRLLGDTLVDAVVAVRGYEQSHFGESSAAELTERFRFTWSI